MSIKYHFRKNTGELTRVCRFFFLTTLGFKSNNDKVILRIVRNSNKQQIISLVDNRGRQPSKNKINTEVVFARTLKNAIQRYLITEENMLRMLGIYT